MKETDQFPKHLQTYLKELHVVASFRNSLESNEFGIAAACRHKSLRFSMLLFYLYISKFLNIWWHNWLFQNAFQNLKQRITRKTKKGCCLEKSVDINKHPVFLGKCIAGRNRQNETQLRYKDVIHTLHKIHTTKTSQNKTQNTNKTDRKQKYNIVTK